MERERERESNISVFQRPHFKVDRLLTKPQPSFSDS